MDPFMLTSVTLLARQEGWQLHDRAPRRARLAPARRRLAATLRAIAVRVEPVPACDPMRTLSAR